MDQWETAVVTSFYFPLICVTNEQLIFIIPYILNFLNKHFKKLDFIKDIG